MATKPKEPEYRHPQGFPGEPPKVRIAGQPLPGPAQEATPTDSQPTEAPPHIADPAVQAIAGLLQTRKNRLNHPEIDDRPLKGWRRANPRR